MSIVVRRPHRGSSLAGSGGAVYAVRQLELKCTSDNSSFATPRAHPFERS